MFLQIGMRHLSCCVLFCSCTYFDTDPDLNKQLSVFSLTEITHTVTHVFVAGVRTNSFLFALLSKQRCFKIMMLILKIGLKQKTSLSENTENVMFMVFQS